MKQTILLTVALLLTLTWPAQAWAYSYGDPNKEDIAETFKAVVVELQNGDWTQAYNAYKVSQAEIKSHFTHPAVGYLEASFAAKNKAAVMANYEAILVLNIDRRFDYARKDINDYAKAKLLMAKSRGTYEVLTPYLPSSFPKQQVEKAYDEALEALGNPGLFGVGQKPVNVDAFNEQTSYILKQLQPIFPAQVVKAVTKQEEPKKPVVKPTKPVAVTQKVEPKKQVTTQPKKTEQKQQSEKIDSKQLKQEEKKVDKPIEKKEEKKVEPKKEEKKVEPKVTAEVKKEEPKKEEAKVVKEEKTQPKTEAAPKEEVEHAAMERTEKTNGTMTVAIFAGIIALTVALLFMLKKKNII